MPSISSDRAEALIAEALQQEGVSAYNANCVARALIAAEIDGQTGHGLSRVKAYCAQAGSGKVRGEAVPAIDQSAPGFARIDAKNGFAFPAIEAALAEVRDLANRQGIAAVSIYNSHHAGQLGAHVEKLAKQGLIALMFSNSPKALAPWGGNAPLFGTNPIAFAAPRCDQPPLVIDLSLSKVARGKVMKAAQLGESIPSDWAVDQNGQPTTDAAAALKGAMLASGDAKGAALALMVEILSAALTGANFSFEASSFFDADGPPPGIGHLLIAISPEAAGVADFTDRLELLLSAIEAQPGTRLPGTSRLHKRQQSAEIEIQEEVLTQLEKDSPT